VRGPHSFASFANEWALAPPLLCACGGRRAGHISVLKMLTEKNWGAPGLAFFETWDSTVASIIAILSTPSLIPADSTSDRALYVPGDRTCAESSSGSCRRHVHTSDKPHRLQNRYLQQSRSRVPRSCRAFRDRAGLRPPLLASLLSSLTFCSGRNRGPTPEGSKREPEPPAGSPEVKEE
jgi:hypothetical protein